jgi:hypothetical protein
VEAAQGTAHMVDMQHDSKDTRDDVDARMRHGLMARYRHVTMRDPPQCAEAHPGRVAGGQTGSPSLSVPCENKHVTSTDTDMRQTPRDTAGRDTLQDMRQTRTDIPDRQTRGDKQGSPWSLKELRSGQEPQQQYEMLSMADVNIQVCMCVYIYIYMHDVYAYMYRYACRFTVCTNASFSCMA